MRRYLLHLDATHGGLLTPSLHGANRCYLVSLARLRSLAPDLFEDSRNVGAELDEVRAQMTELTTKLDMLAGRIAVVHGELLRARRPRSAPVGQAASAHSL
jgi:hypothetical protein